MALFAVLSLTAVSCQKENIVNPLNPAVSDAEAIYTVCYTVDGVTTQVTLIGDAAWDDFLDWLFALAEQGHRVSFSHAGWVQGLTKEKVIYTTPDHDDAQAWALQKVKEGYHVTIEYDEANQQYTCIAIK